MAQLLDGRQVAALWQADIAAAITAHCAAGGRPPGLAVILVGDDAASAIYVRNKRQACARAGVRSVAHDLPAAVEGDQVLALIDELNEDPAIDGILVQLPLPQHLDQARILNRIAAHKDVDGFHAYNIGRLALRQPGLRPSTPRGIMYLLAHYGLEVMGRNAVIVGASNIVGRPMALELLLAGATVTVAHRFTRNLAAHVKMAEILVVATGKRGVVDPAWLRPDAVAIDVGIHRLADGRVTGDLDFQAAGARAAWITPVPGGVGPMTVSALLQNTIEAAGLAAPSKGSSFY